ncbi:MAG: DUF1638 domain-containing protein [Candidatus Nanopelagicaceae bacterium]|nr:DUF1638 domain-containing protein [Candidatus Nanopelagicaceae bacterium]
MTTAVIACGAIASHISNIASRENFDITIYPLPPLLHNQPEKIAGEVESKIAEIKDRYQKIAVAYSDCGTYGALDKVIEKYGIQRLGGDHCYDVFAGKERVFELTTSGTYFFTDYLVKSFHRSVVVELGLDKHPELIDDYFKNYQKVVWLAQNPTEELKIAAQAAADLMKLPLEIEIVGESGLLDELKRLLNHI